MINLHSGNSFTKSIWCLAMILLGFVTPSATLAQKLDSVQVNGSYFYVYPYGQELVMSEPLRASLEFSMSKKQFLALLNSSNPGLSVQEQEGLYKTYKSYTSERSSYNKQKKSATLKSISKLVRDNANRFYQTNYSLDTDIVPPLDAMPDGKYIQYFTNYVKVMPDGSFEMDSKRTAGFFELKNNKLHGNAVWFNAIGDSVKYGRFDQGLKEGNWVLSRHIVSGMKSLNRIQAMLSSPPVYITSENIFSAGLKHGAYTLREGRSWKERGMYKSGKEAGEWFFYENDLTMNDGVFKDTVYLRSHYTLAEKEIVTHKPFIRGTFPESVNPQVPRLYYDFPSNLDFPRVEFDEFWRVAVANEEDLELPEESIQAYEGEEYENYYVPESAVSEDFIWIGDKYVKRGKVIDSIGIIFKYQDVYEEFYPDGSHRIKLHFENGDLVSEDTIFWKNGLPSDVVVFLPEQQVYENRKYDYKGVLYEVLVYDSLGDFRTQSLDPFYREKHILIEGLDAAKESGAYNLYRSDYKQTGSFTYANYDTLSRSPKGNVPLFRSWYDDTLPWKTAMYDASSRTLTREARSLNQQVKELTIIEFDESFDSYRGKTISKLGALRIENTFNGIYQGQSVDLEDGSIYEKNTIPEERVQYIGSYTITGDALLYKGENLFSGDFSMTFGNKNTGFSFGKQKISIDLSKNNAFKDKMQKDLENYRKTGKTKYPDLLSVAELYTDHNTEVMGFFPFLDKLFEDQLTYMQFSNGKKSSNQVFIKEISGKIQNGKPEGVWKIFDQHGKVITIFNFRNGEFNGERKDYDYAYPAAQAEYMYEMEGAGYMKYESYPAKKTYFLRRVMNYKNGMLSGHAATYDWKGGATSGSDYRDGYLQGPSFERNAIATTYINYQDDRPNGPVRTFLHIPGRDTLLLYNLNFSNGLLQGESKSYHTNGKLSRRGFFLNGRPIDDYEGYDTLGTRYHYVKFQYSFPVEEKIWEANELSVRYEFDWRDSIFFMPSDITQSTSVEAVLYELGLMEDEYSQPYYGRPSLVDKEGITYHMTKYFPNDTIAREGSLSSGKKVGCWQFYSYDGEKLYEVEYFDTLIVLNDSVRFKSKGILYDYDASGKPLSESYIIEKFEKYDCSHTDHYEIRQYYTKWEAHDSLHRKNGYVKNYYDNGTLQSEGTMKDGLPAGIWKFYDPYGKLNQVGEYVSGKRNGRWLSGDLSKTKYLGDICMNPNLPDLEDRMKYQEKLLDIYVRHFRMGKILQSEYYGLNLNDYGDNEAVESESQEGY